MSWQDILKNDSDYKSRKKYKDLSPEKQKELDEKYDRLMPKLQAKRRSLEIKQYQAMLRMLVGKHGKDSEEVLDLGKKFMAINPTEEEIDGLMNYLEELPDKPKPRTPMDEFKDRQKLSQQYLDSMRDD